MERDIKIYKDRLTGTKVLEIYDLSFISDRNHSLGWFGLHYRHLRIKFLLKWADKVLVPDYSVAVDIMKYYFYPGKNIVVDRSISIQ